MPTSRHRLFPFPSLLSPLQLFEFIEFHRVVHNTSHFYLYDAGGVDNRTLALLQRHVAEGLVTVTNLREALLFSVKQWGQVGAGECRCIHGLGLYGMDTTWIERGRVVEGWRPGCGL